MCNWMCNVNFYSYMLGEPETLLLLNLPTTTVACSCVLMSLSVTYCLSLDLLCDSVNLCDSYLLLCVCHLLSFDELEGALRPHVLKGILCFVHHLTTEV